MIWLAVIAGSLGLALLTIGLRGRRVDAAALCRVCRYQLAPAAGAPRPGRCPECGRSTDRVRVGHRRKSRPAIALAIGLLLAGLALGGYAAVSLSNGANRYKPVWMLRAEMASADPAVQTAAVDELVSRFKADKLGHSQIKSVFDQLVRLQGDRSKAWDNGLTELTSLLSQSGHVSTVQLGAFGRQAFQPRFVFRPVVDYNCDIPYDIEWSMKPERGADAVNIRYMARVTNGVSFFSPTNVVWFVANGRTFTFYDDSMYSHAGVRSPAPDWEGRPVLRCRVYAFLPAEFTKIREIEDFRAPDQAQWWETAEAASFDSWDYEFTGELIQRLAPGESSFRECRLRPDDFFERIQIIHTDPRDNSMVSVEVFFNPGAPAFAFQLIATLPTGERAWAYPMVGGLGKTEFPAQYFKCTGSDGEPRYQHDLSGSDTLRIELVPRLDHALATTHVVGEVFCGPFDLGESPLNGPGRPRRID